jgi:hypothetical protein
MVLSLFAENFPTFGCCLNWSSGPNAEGDGKRRILIRESDGSDT